MRIGVPQEIKNHEYRVGLSAASVRALCARGHEVIVQSGAGQAIGMLDEQYRAAGARLESRAQTIFEMADMIVKVKEPQESECALLRADQILLTYLHLAADAVLTKRLLDVGVVGVAYETITSASGGLPLLAPMSEVAGRMSIQAAATHLEKSRGGLGILLGGVPGVPPRACCGAGRWHGWQQAMRRDPHLLAGLNVCNGQITHKAVAESLNLTFTEPGQMLAS